MNLLNKPHIAASIAAVLACAGIGQAATVAAWNFDDADEESALSAPATFNASSNPGRVADIALAGVSVSSITVGSGATARLRDNISAPGAAGGPLMLGGIGYSGTAVTATTALNNNDAFFLTITPGVSALNLTNVSFDFTSDGNASATADRKAALFVNTGSGYTQVGSDLSDNGQTYDDTLNESLSLSNLTSPVTFALVGWNPGNTSGTATVSFKNIVIEGNVVPEPATLSLLAGATLLGLRRRR